MISPAVLREHIIRPALRHLTLWSEGAEDLLLGTAAVESRCGRYLRQLGGGPALGIWQVEPRTHTDLWDNYLRHRKPLADFVRALADEQYLNGYLDQPVDAEALVGLPVPGYGEPGFEDACRSHWYAAAVARLCYRRAPEPIPPAGDWMGMAALWKLRYNTPLGRGTPEKFMQTCVQCGVIRNGVQP